MHEFTGHCNFIPQIRITKTKQLFRLQQKLCIILHTSYPRVWTQKSILIPMKGMVRKLLHLFDENFDARDVVYDHLRFNLSENVCFYMFLRLVEDIALSFLEGPEKLCPTDKVYSLLNDSLSYYQGLVYLKSGGNRCH